VTPLYLISNELQYKYRFRWQLVDVWMDNIWTVATAALFFLVTFIMVSTPSNALS